jgi:hypothetical protein
MNAVASHPATLSSYGCVKIPLQTFIAWIQTPMKISMAIASLKRLQTQLTDQQQRAAVHRVQIRQLRQEVKRGTRRRVIRPVSSHPDHDILILDGQQAARFDSLPKAAAAIPPGLLFFYGAWRP